MRTGMRFQVVVALVVLLASATGLAQTSPTLAFEVASVRMAAPGGRFGQRLTQTRVDMTNTPLRSLVMTAFGIRASQLTSPDWMDKVAFDIQAILPAGTTGQQVPAMLQTLL